MRGSLFARRWRTSRRRYSLATYIAHYKSPNSAEEHLRGTFEFESDARLGTKQNASDARISMLELFGNDAIAWNVHKIERKPKRGAQMDGQFELDFREPKKKTRKKKREYW